MRWRLSARADDWAAPHSFSSGDRGTILGNPGTDFIWGGGQLVDAWPGQATHEYDRVRTSRVETLLIGGELDFAAPPQVVTKELLPYLPNGKQVVLPGWATRAPSGPSSPTPATG